LFDPFDVAGFDVEEASLSFLGMRALFRGGFSMAAARASPIGAMMSEFAISSASSSGYANAVFQPRPALDRIVG
jgi:hypothetical protein